jgi:predicted RNA-binding protein YlxR (DUF448 family)
MGCERTCAGCRRRAAREELLRFVADERGHLRFDARQRLAGRGAYACPDSRCLARALAKGFARSLRRRLAAEQPERLASSVRAALGETQRELERQALADGRGRRAAAGVLVTEPRLGRRLALLAQQARRLGEGVAAAVGNGREGIQK